MLNRHLRGLTLELSGPLRQRTGPARPMIDNDGLAGPVRCRSGSALERRVRPNTVQIEVFRRQFVSVETTTGADDGENTQGTAGEG